MWYSRLISKISVIIFGLLLFCSSVLANPLLGDWVAYNGSFSFRGDGTFTMVTNGQQIQGYWGVAGNNILQFQTSAGNYQYHAFLQGDYLTLQDANGYYQFQRQQGTTTAPTTPRTPPATQNTPPAQGTLSDAQFVQFLTNYPGLSPDQVFQYGQAFSQNQRDMLKISKAIGYHIYTTMCAGSYAQYVVYDSMSGPIGCPQLIQQAQIDAQARASTGMIGGDYANTQRMELINVFSCSAGLKDKASCAAYQQAQQGMNDATMQNTNTAGNVYQCTPYYDSVTGEFLYCL